MNKTIPTSLRVLLDDIVDYAGLFPPASLDMATAARSFAAHRQSTHAFMLGRFVLPAGRLNALAKAVDQLEDGTVRGPWPLSVLTGDDPDGARTAIDRFADTHAEIGTVVAIEARAASPADIARVAACFPHVERFVEIAHDRDPSDMMRALASTGSRAKIRTGGVTDDAFPTAAEVARFIVAAHDAGIAFKATAGLHHPLCGAYRLTYEDGSPSGRMFGFLGVFMAATAVRAGITDEALLGALLEASDANDFVFDQDGASWRDVRVSHADLEATRSSFARSYGSCSFDEPTGDLESLGLL